MAAAQGASRGKRKRDDEEDATATKARPEGSEGKDVARRPTPAPERMRDDSYFRGLYAAELDFRQMARRDPPFAAVLKPTGQLDFSDPAAVMQLTKTILRLDFGLEIELPDDRLCPPVPNRHNYILWLKSLLDSSSYDEPGGKLTGLDIGTGASCIYPLLGCSQRSWFFIGTDIDKESLSYATANVKRNGLEHRIKLVSRSQPTDPVIPLDELGLDSIDFAMTNPPFYESADELAALARKKARPPLSACTGAPVEMVCEGGEAAFVGRMLAESLTLRERVRWYTAMLGKLSSLEALVDRLREEGIDNYAVTEFVQGTRTKRWAVGWSFGAMRPSPEAARGMAQLAWKKILPVAVDVEVGSCQVREVGAVAARVDALMQELELLDWTWEKQLLRGVARMKENVWGRAWRRKKLQKERQEQGGAEMLPAATGSKAKDGSQVVEKPISGFMISISVSAAGGSISCRWREGYDEAMFQSFCGFLKGKLTPAEVSGGS